MKKKLLSLALALVMCLSLAVPALAAEPVIEEVIPCTYDNAGDFSEGLAWVVKNGKAGFIDKTGEIVIPCQYDGSLSFFEGLAGVQKDGKWGFINKAGETVIPCQYDGVDDFVEGLARIQKGSKYGFINKTDEEIVPCQYDYASYFSDGLAFVVKDNKYGFINKAGEEVIPCQYDGASVFSEGLTWVAKDGKGGFVNKTGELVIPYEYDGLRPFAEGLAAVQKDQKYGFINKTGELVVPREYDGALSFSEGLALVVKDDKCGFINKDGKEIVPCQYTNAGSFSEGFAPVQSKDDGDIMGVWGYIDKTGKEVVPLQYSSARSFSDGMARVSKMEIASQKGNGKDQNIELAERFGFITIVKSSEPVEVTAKVSDWAKELVDGAASAGLIADGLGEDYTANITRAQFAAAAVKLYEAMSGEAAPAAGEEIAFSDTTDPVVLQAAALEIVKGSEGRFSPDALVTREDAALMLSRVYTKLGGEIPEVDATAFADDADMSGYARNAIAFMSGKEIVGGVGNNKFDPKGSASIEQALIIALRMFEKLK